MKKRSMVALALLLCLTMTACGESKKNTVNTDIAVTDNAVTEPTYTGLDGYDDYDSYGLSEKGDSLVIGGEGYVEDSITPSPIAPAMGKGTIISETAATQPVSPDSPAPSDTDTDAAAETTKLPENRTNADTDDIKQKLIITVSVRAEVKNINDFSESLDKKVESLKGYIESSEYATSYNGTTYSVTVRVPAESLDTFLSDIGKNAKILTKQKDSTDVSLQYSDTETKLKTYRAERDRLVELLDKADTIPDIMDIEDRLTEVKSRIENSESELRYYDSAVNYSTVHLYISENSGANEGEPKKPTYFEKIIDSLADSVDGLSHLFLFIMSHIFQIAIFVAVIVIVIRFILKKAKKE